MTSKESARFPEGFPSWRNNPGVLAVHQAWGESIAAETSHDAQLTVEEKLRGIPWEVNDHRPELHDELHEPGDEK